MVYLSVENPLTGPVMNGDFCSVGAARQYGTGIGPQRGGVIRVTPIAPETV